jgi:hypothetical protein
MHFAALFLLYYLGVLDNSVHEAVESCGLDIACDQLVFIYDHIGDDRIVSSRVV